MLLPSASYASRADSYVDWQIGQSRTALAEQTPSKFQIYMSGKRVGVRKARTPKLSDRFAE